MSFALLQTALLLPLEFSINRVLALDAASKTRLQKLEGRTLALQSTQPEAALFVCVRDTGLHLTAVYEGTPAASLHGPLSALLGLLVRREAIDNLRARQLELRGDTAFVQQLQELLLGLDIDWEYQLAKLVGDIPTQALSTGLREASALLRKTGTRLREDLREYVYEEKRLLPAAEELEAFYQEVAELKLRADRLQARIAGLPQ